AVVVSTGRENMDLAVGLDLTVAYLGAEKMNHPFRVLETVCLRIKHADAICTIA
ncbi:MAG TPA: bacteriocin, partial [Myxococcales bacterium]|nr:bacteriocin [Myxococcales bacterium]